MDNVYSFVDEIVVLILVHCTYCRRLVVVLLDRNVPCGMT